jgi:ATP/maltotriose-dependent transcriptional regulator MalT
MLLTTRGRKQEGLAVMRFGLTTALEHDKPSAALRASYNLADTLSQMDRYDEAVDLVREGLAHARRVGNRYWEWSFLGQVYPLFAVGAWDEALEMIGALPEEQWRQARQAFGAAPSVGVLIHVNRGNLEEAVRIIELFEELATSADLQERAVHTCGKARVLLAEGSPEEALLLGAGGLELRATLGYTQEFLKELHVTTAEAALSLGDTERVDALVGELEALPLGTSSQFLQAQSSRFRAHLAAREGDTTNAERLFKGASGLFRELAFPFYLATTQLEYAEWLEAQGRIAELSPVVAEARQIFGQLGARPLLERSERIAGAAPVPA